MYKIYKVLRFNVPTVLCFVKKVETREDEEQNVKLRETVDLLLAAGYFRARIKGLSPFDKVVISSFC